MCARRRAPRRSRKLGIPVLKPTELLRRVAVAQTDPSDGDCVHVILVRIPDIYQIRMAFRNYPPLLVMIYTSKYSSRRARYSHFDESHAG